MFVSSPVTFLRKHRHGICKPQNVGDVNEVPEY